MIEQTRDRTNQDDETKKREGIPSIRLPRTTGRFPSPEPCLRLLSMATVEWRPSHDPSPGTTKALFSPSMAAHYSYWCDEIHLDPGPDSSMHPGSESESVVSSGESMKERKSNADWRLGDDQALLHCPKSWILREWTNNCRRGSWQLANGCTPLIPSVQSTEEAVVLIWGLDRSTTKDVVSSCIGPWRISQCS